MRLREEGVPQDPGIAMVLSMLLVEGWGFGALHVGDAAHCSANPRLVRHSEPSPAPATVLPPSYPHSSGQRRTAMRLPHSHLDRGHDLGSVRVLRRPAWRCAADAQHQASGQTLLVRPLCRPVGKAPTEGPS